MKATISLVLLSAGMALAQNPDPIRRGEQGPRLEGTYQSNDRKDSIHRVLRLDRDGKAEISTEIRRDGGRERRRDDWDKADTHKYGRLAEEATFGHPLRHTGRWTLRDGNVLIRMDDLSPDVHMRPDIDLVLYRRDGNLVLDRNNDFYGILKITFRADGDADSRPVPSARFGYVRYGAEELVVDGIDLTDRGDDSLLVVRAGSRRIEIKGGVRRRGDEVTFRLPYDGRTGGAYTLRMRGNVVESISGKGAVDRRRIEFRESRDRG